MSNDYAAMETKQCPVCLETHSHNTAILLHKKLRKIDPDKTCTGFALCEEHEKLFNDGYIALVVGDSSSSKDTVQHTDVNRTGEFIHIKREYFSSVFGEVDADLPMAYTETEVVDMIKNRYAQAMENQNDNSQIS